MTETVLLAGSLSNDLFRVVNLQQRGSTKAAQRFLQEAKRWAQPLSEQAPKKYIKDIAEYINHTSDTDLSAHSIERYLMYGVLLQNFVAKHS